MEQRIIDPVEIMDNETKEVLTVALANANELIARGTYSLAPEKEKAPAAPVQKEPVAKVEPAPKSKEPAPKAKAAAK